jgi:hypothetical protein
MRRRYILRYGMTNNYIGEARSIGTYNGVDMYVSVGDYTVVDDLEKALKFTKKKAEDFLKSYFASEAYTSKLGGELHPLEVCGDDSD